MLKVKELVEQDFKIPLVWEVSLVADTDAAAEGAVKTVPLQFWFCRNPGLALPLIALQYHEVKIINEIFQSLSKC